MLSFVTRPIAHLVLVSLCYKVVLVELAIFVYFELGALHSAFYNECFVH